MGRAKKPADNLNRHATREELEDRKKEETASLSGIPIRESSEVASNPVAHAEFLRVIELLTAVGKNDAMFEAVINEYCTYKAKIAKYEVLLQQIEENDELKDEAAYKLILGYDKQIEAYKKKRFDIERETGFTVASALRSIPKKQKPKMSALQEALHVNKH